MSPTHRKGGFTLLELLVVIAILATISGGLIVSYDGLETDAAEGVATFNIAAIDKAVRSFKVMNKSFPDNLDALVVDGAAEFCTMLPNKLQGADGNPTTDDGKLVFYSLTAADVATLNAAGVTTGRFIIDSASNVETEIPNRVFDDPSRGNGTGVTLAAGQFVPIIETKGLSGRTDSERLQDIAGLDPNVRHIVIAFGLGNNSTMIDSAATGGLSEAPFYTKVKNNEYGRFLLLYHVASDTDGDGTIQSDEQFSTAKFLKVLDTRGDWYDEEYAEYTNQKT